MKPNSSDFEDHKKKVHENDDLIKKRPETYVRLL